jgi:NADP-dependent 3-hydroxy acid dehydrogenase YdfG
VLFRSGCSSGLGRETVKNLLATDKYHVIGAVRDVDKMEAVAEIDGFNMNNFHMMDCELNSFASVHKFCADLKEYRLAKPIDRLICNAGGEKNKYVMIELCLVFFLLKITL